MTTHTICFEHSFAADAGAPLLSKCHQASHLGGQHSFTACMVSLCNTNKTGREIYKKVKLTGREIYKKKRFFNRYIFIMSDYTGIRLLFSPLHLISSRKIADLQTQVSHYEHVDLAFSLNIHSQNSNGGVQVVNTTQRATRHLAKNGEGSKYRSTQKNDLVVIEEGILQVDFSIGYS